MAAFREYERTHTWISFRLPSDRAEPLCWAMLGTAAARCQQAAAAVLPPGAAQELHTLYLSRGARATTAIDGNTLTEAEVNAQIEGRLDLPASREHLGREVRNMVAAYQQIVATVRTGPPPTLSTEWITLSNRLALEGLDSQPEPEVALGQIRDNRVVVLLDRLCRWLSSGPTLRIGSDDENRLANGILRAILAHLYLAWIHPFRNGNGRTARLVEYLLLTAAGVPPPAAHLLSDHYHRTHPAYHVQRKRGSHAGAGAGDPWGFIAYALEGFVAGLAEHCREIARVQAGLAWKQLVHQEIRGTHPSAAYDRRREIALSLARQSAPVRRRAVPDLSPALARLFARKTAKTLTRDLNWLIQAGFVQRTRGGYRARIGIVQGFRIPLAA